MSNRGDLTDRMLFMPLFIAERPRSQRELASHFGVKARTVRRAIDALSRVHPIVSVRDGKEVRYSYTADYKYQPPSLTPRELAALLLAQESIAATSLTIAGSPFSKYGQSLLAKVRASEHCFNGIHGEPITIRLRASGVTARIFAEWTFHPSQRVIEPVGPDPLGQGASRRLDRSNASASEPRHRFHFHFTPTGSSWLNQVERWFAEITNKRIRRCTFDSVTALEKAIYEYLAAWNQDPKPFVWRATADIILAKVERCKELSVTGH